MAWRHFSLSVAGFALAALLPVAAAQYASDETLTRPSARSPSQYGSGTFTRFAPSPLEAPQRPVSLFGESATPFRASERNSAYSKLLSPAQLKLGVVADWSGEASKLTNLWANRESDAALISGLDQVRSLDMPLPGTRVGQLPTLDAYRFTPAPEATRFQQLVGLLPNPTRPDGDAQASAAERLSAVTTTRVGRAQDDGLRLFKQATVQVRDMRTGRYSDCPECAAKLASAIQQLRLVRDLDSGAYLPPLLMAHAFLEQDRPTQAIAALLEAFRRQPDLLTLDAGPAFGQYFGDAQGEGAQSAFLLAQMRRYRQVGESGGDAALSKVLEAYCAWRLGDYAQAREAVDAVEKWASRVPQRAEVLLSFSTGLRTVLH